ncbi:MAG: ATP-dependent Clp protease proteolytic subunit, partial [Alphaproteobacteria bacterium]|nr:ATP-dependent Clp protease proteolytic subunit [Alphaproteobacteria bacterium]
MDVWAVLSLIAEVALRLWNEISAVVAVVPPRFAVAGACLFMALVLLALAFTSRRAPRAPMQTQRPATARRRGKLSADEAFADYAPGRDLAPSPPLARNTFASANEPQGPSLGVPASTRDIVARLEAKRGSRVIAIIHRENMERGFLDVADLEDTLTAIRQTPKDKPLDIIIHSPGGHIRVGQQIARAIKAHPAKTTVFVPYFALGSTTFMAFAADEIVMSAHAALSPVDPFAGAGPASSVLKGIKSKPIAKVADETVICADIAQKLLNEAKRVTCELMESKHDHDGVCRMADELVSGKFSRDRAITATSATMLGLNVSVDMPSEVFDLIRSCRRGNEHDTSVTFLDHDLIRSCRRGNEHDTSVTFLDHVDRKIAPSHDRVRSAMAVGAIDSGVVHLAERAKGQPRSAVKTAWLAHSGGHLPEDNVSRAKTLIRRIEQERGSRVICIIHGENMENEAFNFDDLEDVLSAIVASDTSKPLDIVLHTQGGNSFTGRQIARAIKSHKARKTVFVPYYAMSAGSRISLAADQIVMGAQATLGPIDTQLYGWPAPSILQLLNVKPIDSISDEFLILAEEARKIMAEGRASACDLLQGTYSH